MREEINTIEEAQIEKNLRELCVKVKRCCRRHDYKTGEKIVINAMGQYPDAAQPHNLYGVLLEKTGQHTAAMRHFRAALALNPSYRPANYNLEQYGQMQVGGKRCQYGDEWTVPVKSSFCLRL